MGPRKYIVGVIAFVLLIWGPIDHTLPVWGVVIRTVYLIAIPTLAWFILAWIWKVWQPDKTVENRISRVLVGVTAVVLLIGSILRMTADYHSECTLKARTHDGYECVGDYERVDGPDVEGAFTLFVGAGLAFYIAIKGDGASEDVS